MKKQLYTAAIIFFAALFTVCAFLLIRYYVQISRSQASYDNLAQIKDAACMKPAFPPPPVIS